MARNVKGLIFSIVSTIAGFITAELVEDGLNKRFNPELEKAKEEEKETLRLAMTTAFDVGKEKEEEEASE